MMFAFLIRKYYYRLILDFVNIGRFHKEAAMKFLSLLSFYLLVFVVKSEAVQVSGYCFLENQAYHSNTKVKFQANSPYAVTDSTYTGVTGYYTINLAQGGYNIYYIHEGYYTEELLSQFFIGTTTLPNVTLLTLGNQLHGYLRGTLTGDTTYFVNDHIYVDAGDSLTIEAGATLIFEPGRVFEVNGYLHIIGTADDSVRLINSPDFSWHGLDFNDAADDSSKIEYCIIRGSGFNGIECVNSSPSIINCSIENNSSPGIYCSNAHPNIVNCVISRNTTFNGGGICCYNSHPTIEGCIISGNVVEMNGGGIYCYNSSSPSILNCIINANSAASGGGIYCLENSSPFISYCEISQNFSSNGGGGISCVNSSPVISNCTISNNSAPLPGGGGGIALSISEAVITNSIITGNQGYYGVFFYNSTNVSISYSDFFDNQTGNFNNPPPGTGIITTTNANGDSCDVFHNIFLDPLFYSTTGDSAFYLTENSPCIDAGDPNSPLDPDNTIADMGAYYFDQSPQPIQDLLITISGENVVLQWTPVTMAVSYNIYRSDTPNFDISGMTPISTTTATNFTDNNALNEEGWFYKVTFVSEP